MIAATCARAHPSRRSRSRASAFAIAIGVVACSVALVPACHPSCDDEPRFAPGSGVDARALACDVAVTCTTQRFCLRVPDTFDGFEKESIADAAADWTAATRGAVDFSCASDASPAALEVAFIKTNDSDPFLASSGEGYARGFEKDGNVYLDMDHLCGSRVFHGVVRHELGHVIGLAHTTDPESVMFSPYNEAHANTSVRTADVLQYQRVHACCVAR
jgi:hypothetical protein